LIRDKQASLLTSTKTRTSEAMTKLTWTEETTFLCRIEPMGGQIARRMYGISEETTHRLFCDPEVPITKGKRVEIDGETYEVVYVASFRFEKEVSLIKV